MGLIKSFSNFLKKGKKDWEEKSFQECEQAIAFNFKSLEKNYIDLSKCVAAVSLLVGEQVILKTDFEYNRHNIHDFSINILVLMSSIITRDLNQSFIQSALKDPQRLATVFRNRASIFCELSLRYFVDYDKKLQGLSVKKISDSIKFSKLNSISKLPPYSTDALIDKTKILIQNDFKISHTFNVDDRIETGIELITANISQFEKALQSWDSNSYEKMLFKLYKEKL